MPPICRTSACQLAPRGALRFLLPETTPRPKPLSSGSSMISGSILWMRAALLNPGASSLERRSTARTSSRPKCSVRSRRPVANGLLNFAPRSARAPLPEPHCANVTPTNTLLRLNAINQFGYGGPGTERRNACRRHTRVPGAHERGRNRMEYLAAATPAYVPESAGCRPGLRYGHFYTRCWCRMADGFARGRPAACGADTNCLGISVFSSRAACRGFGGHL